MNENEYFETSDLSLVAALCSFGAKIEALERNNGPRVVFYIKREKGLDQLVRVFYARELQVDPLTYYNCLRDAKSRLYGSPIE